MAWYDEAVFYHIYPLGLTGAPKKNHYDAPEHRLNTLIPWISHIREIGCNAIYIGPLFESVGHGYETTDYKKLDSRLGTNEDLTNFVKECHAKGIRVILDGVFNHVGRDFFAFQDLKHNRENSVYKDWFCNINFWGNNEYNDGFSYENWGGYNLLVKLNQKNSAVRDYICDVIRFWVREYDIDGIRLDAADVLDFGYMQALRHVANEVKPDFWLMGEVIHGDYTRWVNEQTLHSVTNYHLHKALYSGHNDHNFFEIAHTVRQQCEMGGNSSFGLKLYNFVDNHDVERIYTKLSNKAHLVPVHVLLYTLPGIPSIYYGSEFGIEGRKERYSDDSLRPALHLYDFRDALENNTCTKVVAALGKVRQKVDALAYGDYKELLLTTTQYAFSRSYYGQTVVTTVNNGDGDVDMSVRADVNGEYVGVLYGEHVWAENGCLNVRVKGNSGELWVPAEVTEDEAVWEPIEAYEPVMEENLGEDICEECSVCKGAANGMRKECSACEKLTDGMCEGCSEDEEAADSTSEECAGDEKLTNDICKGCSGDENPVCQNVMERKDGQTDTLKDAHEKKECAEKPAEPKKVEVPKNKSYEEMTIEELQQAILDRMAKNGPVTDRMRQDVMENVWHNSLLTWVRSFN